MKLTLPVLVLVFFSSCAEHQYLTVSGLNINKNDNHEFVSENDTLKLVYHFEPEQGKVLISVFNLTDQPVVADWWKSAMIIDNRSFSFYNPDARINGQIGRDTSGFRRTVSGTNGSYYADVNGVVHLNETSQFIPAHSEISREMDVFRMDTLKNLPIQQAKKDTIRASYSTFISYKKMSFEREQSPLVFRSYLTFRIGKANEEKEFSLEHRFYISEVWKSRAALQEFPENITSRGDMIYLAP